MERIILKASEGMVYTDGISGGKVVYLAVGQTADGWWYEVPEADFIAAMESGVPIGHISDSEALSIIVGGEENDEK